MTRVVLGGIEIRRRTSLTGLRINLASLRSFEPDVPVVLVNRSPSHAELQSLLDRYQVASIPSSHPETEIEIARFLDYRPYLGDHPSDQVLMIDLLDLVWQGPLPATPELTFYQEQVRVIDCPYNSRWLYETCPDDWMDLAADPVVCCGVIGGPLDAVVAYLDDYAGRYHPGVRRGFDSAVANRYRGPRRLVPSTNPVCMHLGYVPKEAVSFDHDRVTANGCAPSLVHQYNRHPDVMKGLVERWT